jgi:hypothetical protein
MIQRAVNTGILPGYVLFDSWYSWPWFIQAIRNIHRKIHVVCRLKDSNVHYWYNGRKYRLSGLYQKIRDGFKKDTRTGLLLKRVKVTVPDSDEPVVIVFSKGYQEPELEPANGRKKKKEPSWVAFLCKIPAYIHLRLSRSISKDGQLKCVSRNANKCSALAKTNRMISTGR